MTEKEIKEMHQIRWFHSIELEPGIVTPGLHTCYPSGSDYYSRRFGLPRELKGQSVLDIGAWDGLYSFEVEKRAASRVLAVDVDQSEGGNWGGTKGFNFAKKILRSNVEFRPINVYELDPVKIGVFDVVMQFGVLYHLKNPLLALENTARVTGKYALIETAVVPRRGIYRFYRNDFPVFAFLPGHADDPTNYFYPNIAGLRAALTFVGFKKVEVIYNDGYRATVKAFKELGDDACSPEPYRWQYARQILGRLQARGNCKKGR